MISANHYTSTKKIQKYLAGEREGFSLVELIIVIAIMAILIGVIALAVIPNIQRSRESKDLSSLDNVLSAANVAVATKKVTGKADNVPYASGSTDPVVSSVWDELGAITLGASCNKDKSITISYDCTDSKSAKITVKTGGTCEYTYKDDGTTKMPMEVSSGGGTTGS